MNFPTTMKIEDLVAAGNVRYCRDSAGAPADVVVAP